MIARVAPIVVAIGLLVALAGCGPSGPGPVGHAGPAATPRASLGRPVSVAPSALTRRPFARSGIAPTRPPSGLAPSPASGPVLSLARRFASAYSAYESGRLTVQIRRTIERTCTAGFAGELLGHIPAVPPRVLPRAMHERLESVEPLANLSGRALVLVVVRRRALGSESAGSLEVGLTDARGRWLVSSLRVVS